MAQLNFDCPLKWPANQPITPRAQQRNDSGFNKTMSLEESLQFITEEVNTLNPQKSTLYTDMQSINNPRARQQTGPRTGACLEMKVGTQFFHLACDRWQLLQHNIYALHLALRAFTNIDKWGVASLPTLLSAFGSAGTSNTSLSGENGEMTEWMRILGLGPTATVDDAVAVYHRRAKSIHQDEKAMAALNTAMDEARKALSAS